MIDLNLPSRALENSAEELLSMISRVEALNDSAPDQTDSDELRSFADDVADRASYLRQIAADLISAAGDMEGIVTEAEDQIEKIEDAADAAAEDDSCPEHRHNYCDC